MHKNSESRINNNFLIGGAVLLVVGLLFFISINTKKQPVDLGKQKFPIEQDVSKKPEKVVVKTEIIQEQPRVKSREKSQLVSKSAKEEHQEQLESPIKKADIWDKPRPAGWYEARGVQVTPAVARNYYKEKALELAAKLERQAANN